MNILSSLNITGAALAPIIGSITLVFAGWTVASFVPFGHNSERERKV